MIKKTFTNPIVYFLFILGLFTQSCLDDEQFFNNENNNHIYFINDGRLSLLNNADNSKIEIEIQLDEPAHQDFTIRLLPLDQKDSVSSKIKVPEIPVKTGEKTFTLEISSPKNINEDEDITLQIDPNSLPSDVKIRTNSYYVNLVNSTDKIEGEQYRYTTIVQLNDQDRSSLADVPYYGDKRVNFINGKMEFTGNTIVNIQSNASGYVINMPFNALGMNDFFSSIMRGQIEKAINYLSMIDETQWDEFSAGYFMKRVPSYGVQPGINAKLENITIQGTQLVFNKKQTIDDLAMNLDKQKLLDAGLLDKDPESWVGMPFVLDYKVANDALAYYKIRINQADFSQMDFNNAFFRGQGVPNPYVLFFGRVESDDFEIITENDINGTISPDRKTINFVFKMKFGGNIEGSLNYPVTVRVELQKVEK